MVYEGGTLKIMYLLFTYANTNSYAFIVIISFEIHIRCPSENLGRKLCLFISFALSEEVRV